MKQIYLDSAATSLQKPENVHHAVVAAMQSAASTGRSSHRAAMKASELVFECRCQAAALFNAPEPDNVVFTCNATHALNIAINSLVRRGDTVLVSGYEHNSVTRPLYAAGARLIFAGAAPFDSRGIYDAFRDNIEKADLVVCTHVSNVFGFVLPIEDIAILCKNKGKPLIIDASQSAGVLDIDFSALGAGYIAMPGHKGLLGPQGTGILLCANDKGSPLIHGGSGSDSLLTHMPEHLPDRFEAGTLNVPGIAGLCEGIKYIRKAGPEKICAHERRLLRLLSEKLKRVEGLEVYLSDDINLQTGVLSIVPPGSDCEGCAAFLADRSIAVRAGLHCAPEAHRTAGTLPHGTVRLSFSPFTIERDLLKAVEALTIFSRMKNKR